MQNAATEGWWVEHSNATPVTIRELTLAVILFAVSHIAGYKIGDMFTLYFFPWLSIILDNFIDQMTSFRMV